MWYVFQATVFVVSQMYNRRYCKFYQFSIRLSKWIRDTYFWTMHIFFNEINIELFYSFWRNKRLVSRHHLFGIPRLKLHQVLQYVYLGSSGQILNAHHPFEDGITCIPFSILAQLLFHTYKFIYFIIPQQER